MDQLSAIFYKVLSLGVLETRIYTFSRYGSVQWHHENSLLNIWSDRVLVLSCNSVQEVVFVQDYEAPVNNGE